MTKGLFIQSNINQALNYFENLDSDKDDIKTYFIYSPNALGERKKEEERTFEYLKSKISQIEYISFQKISNIAKKDDVIFSTDSYDEMKVIKDLKLKLGNQNRLLDSFEYDKIKTFTPFRHKVEKNLPHKFTHDIYQASDEEVLRELNYYFYETHLAKEYFDIRNGVIGRDYSTKFSKYLSNGRLNVRYLYNYITDYEEECGGNKSTYWIKFELLWREFFYWSYQKHRTKFFSLNGLKGETDYIRDLGNIDFEKSFKKDPFMFACLRELVETGFMSNRFRQVFASNFIHTYKFDWREGAYLFEQYLIDYDVYSNWGNWQYLAGVGHDPRGTRIFNIFKQLENYDPTLSHMKKWAKIKNVEDTKKILQSIYQY